MKIIYIILIITLFVSCTNDKKSIINTQIQKPNKDYFELVSPNFYDTIVCNSLVDFKISLNDSFADIDSVHLYVNGVFLKSYYDINFSEIISPKHVGRNRLKISVFINDSNTQSINVEPFFLSDVIPQNLKYKLVNSFPHSTKKFTQGLVYKDGLMYEGTGNWGKSGVFITKLETGELINSQMLPPDKFGEGITLLNNRIIQLTYQAREGYVYQFKTLEKQSTFKYSFSTEGWGITADEESFYMSNGTDKILVMDSTYYSVYKEIQVCDNKGPIDSLNELEFVNGLIYSNIWMDNRIAQIDSKTGKVLGYLDLISIIPDKYRKHHSNVLNGIAYNKENGNLFITGKHWDKIYEIELIDK